MGKRDEQRKLKVCVLSRIKERKSVLFGQFSSTLTKEMKIKAWQEVCDYAKAIGAVGQGKDYKYLRDVWFNNARKSTMEKIDNAKKTGTGGGENSKTTEVADFILDIIGKESPIVEGLGVSDSLDDDGLSIPALSPSPQVQTLADTDEVVAPPISKPTMELNRKEKLPNKGKEEDPLTKLKIEKMKLTIENLEKESYFKTLQIMKLERELLLPPSRFTSYLSEEGEAIYVLAAEDEH